MATLSVRNEAMPDGQKTLRHKLLDFLIQEVKDGTEYGDLASVLMNVTAEWMTRDLVGFEETADSKVVHLFLVKRFAAAFNDARNLVTK